MGDEILDFTKADEREPVGPPLLRRPRGQAPFRTRTQPVTSPLNIWLAGTISCAGWQGCAKLRSCSNGEHR
jgi:hypothetical protein